LQKNTEANFINLQCLIIFSAITFKIEENFFSDHIPGLDDDFYDDLSRKPPQPLPPQNRLGPPGVRPGVSTAPPQAQPEQTGGLLGGLTSGISGLTGGGGVTGKLGDIGGSAAGAAGGLLNSGKGLFKKFGF